ncbi:hypothetical protein D3C74_406070 [compost metagenome]
MEAVSSSKVKLYKGLRNRMKKSKPNTHTPAIIHNCISLTATIDPNKYELNAFDRLVWRLINTTARASPEVMMIATGTSL